MCLTPRSVPSCSSNFGMARYSRWETAVSAMLQQQLRDGTVQPVGHRGQCHAVAATSGWYGAAGETPRSVPCCSSNFGMVRCSGAAGGTPQSVSCCSSNFGMVRCSRSDFQSYAKQLITINSQNEHACYRWSR